MWQTLYIQRTITSTKELDVPPVNVLEFLHDTPSMIMRSPVASSFQQLASSSGRATYTITDRVPMLFGLLHIYTTVMATFTQRVDGASMDVDALMGTHLSTNWFVEERLIPAKSGGSGLHKGALLVETIELTVNVIDNIPSDMLNSHT